MDGISVGTAESFGGCESCPSVRTGFVCDKAGFLLCRTSGPHACLRPALLEPAMTYLLPPLNALRAFEAAARHLSFKQAAHELHLTAAPISQQVRQLEERLGGQLFERLTRQVILTHAGGAYLTPIRKAFGRIHAAPAALMPEGTP